MITLSDYLEVKEKAKQFSALEKSMRIQLLEETFPGERTGQTISTIFQDYQVKGTFGINIALSPKVDIELLSPEAAKAIKLKPTLVKSVYNKLSADELLELEDFITMSPALPTITLTPLPEDVL